MSTLEISEVTQVLIKHGNKNELKELDRRVFLTIAAMIHEYHIKSVLELEIACKYSEVFRQIKTTIKQKPRRTE